MIPSGWQAQEYPPAVPHVSSLTPWEVVSSPLGCGKILQPSLGLLKMTLKMSSQYLLRLLNVYGSPDFSYGPH